jgi:hypothetical protein
MSYHVAQWLSAFSECLPTADLNTLDTLDVFVLLLCSEYLSSQILCTDYMYLHMDIVPVSQYMHPSILQLLFAAYLGTYFLLPLYKQYILPTKYVQPCPELVHCQVYMLRLSTVTERRGSESEKPSPASS